MNWEKIRTWFLAVFLFVGGIAMAVDEHQKRR